MCAVYDCAPYHIIQLFVFIFIVYIANIQPIHEPNKIADKYSVRCGKDTLIRKVSSLDLQHFILNFLPHLYNSLQTVHQRSPLYLPLLFLLRHLLKRYDFKLCWYIFHYSLVSHLISTLIIISKPTEIPTDVPTFDVSLHIHNSAISSRV